MAMAKITIGRPMISVLSLLAVLLLTGAIEELVRGEMRREEIRWRESVDRALAGDAIAAEIVGVSVVLRVTPPRTGRRVDPSVAALFLQRAAENGLPAAKLVLMEDDERASPGLVDSLDRVNLEGFASGVAYQLASRLAKVGLAQCEGRLVRKAHGLRRHASNSMTWIERQTGFNSMNDTVAQGESDRFNAKCNPPYQNARVEDGSPS